MRKIFNSFVLITILVLFLLLACGCSGFSNSDVSEKSTIDCKGETEIKNDSNNASSLDGTFSGEDNLSGEDSVITSK